MYRLPLPDASFDVAVLQMVLHHAEDPERVLDEAARLLRPGGRLIVIDLAGHRRTEVVERLAHRWPGFGDDTMQRWLASAGLLPGQKLSVPGVQDLPVRIWCATRSEAAVATRVAELTM